MLSSSRLVETIHNHELQQQQQQQHQHESQQQLSQQPVKERSEDRVKDFTIEHARFHRFEFQKNKPF
jgi:hypothetical protein